MRDPSKVTLIAPVYPYRGGIAHFTTCLARALAETASCQVVSFQRLYPGRIYPGASDHDPSGHHLRVDADFMLDSLNPLTWMRASRQVSQSHPNAVVLQWWTTFLAPCYLTMMRSFRHRRIPVLLIVHNILPHEARFFDPWITRKVLGSADGLILLSARERARLMQFMPTLRNFHVYPHPPYDIFAGNRLPREEAKRRLGVPADRPLVLFFGFVRPYKGIPILIESIQRLQALGFDLHLAIAGEIWGDGSPIKRLIEEKGLGNRVFLDDRYIPNEEMQIYFSAADVFVAPYTQGTQSGAASIALGYDIPIVASEQIAEGLVGVARERLWSVPPGDSAALAEAIADSLRSAPGSRSASVPEKDLPTWKGLAELIVDLGRKLS